MSTPLRFMEAPGRRVQVKADLRAQSSLDVILVLKRAKPIVRPIDVALALKAFGLRLRDAHSALNRIVAGEAIELRLGNADRQTMIARLEELGVEAR